MEKITKFLQNFPAAGASERHGLDRATFFHVKLQCSFPKKKRRKVFVFAPACASPMLMMKNAVLAANYAKRYVRDGYPY